MRRCFPTGEQEAAMGNLADFLHVMRHHDAGDAQRRVKRLDQAQDHGQRNRIEPGKGFVVDQQLRIHDDGPRQGHASCHAARERTGGEFSCAAQTHGLQLHEYQPAQQRFRQSGMGAQREGHVFKDIEIAHQGAILEQHPDPSPQGVQGRATEPPGAFAEDREIARIGANRPHDQAQQRGLAGAAGTHHRGDFAAAYRQVEAVEYGAAADRVAQVAHLDHGFGRRCWTHQAAWASIPGLKRPLRARLLSRAHRPNSRCPASMPAGLPPQAVSAASCSARP